MERRVCSWSTGRVVCFQEQVGREFTGKATFMLSPGFFREFWRRQEEMHGKCPQTLNNLYFTHTAVPHWPQEHWGKFPQRIDSCAFAGSRRALCGESWFLVAVSSMLGRKRPMFRTGAELSQQDTGTCPGDGQVGLNARQGLHRDQAGSHRHRPGNGGVPSAAS